MNFKLSSLNAKVLSNIPKLVLDKMSLKDLAGLIFCGSSASWGEKAPNSLEKQLSGNRCGCSYITKTNT